MADDIGGLLLLGLLGLLVASASSADKPKKVLALPPPEGSKLPTAFMPIPGKRRVIETVTVIEEGNQAYRARVYEPPFVPAPWAVRTWFEPHRHAHVIDVVAHPLLRKPDALTVRVLVGEKHQPDRAAFKRDAKSLWPDDKFENRVVHRMPGAARGVCFLIEVVAFDLRIDFFHEPYLADAASVEDESVRASKPFAVIHEIEELVKTYTEEIEKLKRRTDLSPDLKRQLESHLMVLFETSMRKVSGSE